MAGQEDRHIELFDKLDFDGWNGPDWQLFSQLHTDDVTVEMMGQRTEGVQAHIDMCQQIVEQNPEMKVTGHPIKIAQGEWTAVVGDITGGQRMVTVASGATAPSRRSTSSLAGPDALAEPDRPLTCSATPITERRRQFIPEGAGPVKGLSMVGSLFFPCRLLVSSVGSRSGVKDRL